MSRNLDELQAAQRAFAQEREWGQFHTPKNLASALAVEAAELLEHFQWLTEEQSRTLPDDKRVQVGEEIADVLLYLLQLSDKLQINVMDAAWRKIGLNAQKYPVDRSRGSIRKYNDVP
jgi:NTP pyrophosphatase (non-canonical NTP hydrolase)